MEQSTNTQLAKKLENQTSIMLPISKNYVEHWGFWEAVREFIQNAVDADSNATVNVFHDEVKIDSIGIIEPQSLLLGESSKRSDNNTIGKYGEGYKLALLVLTRMGYHVTIGTGDQLWVPNFKRHPQLGTECLFIDIGSRPYSQFTTVTVVGLKPSDADELSHKYLPLRKDYEVVVSNGGRQALDDTDGCYTDVGMPNKNIFVSGLWVCELPEDDFWFSYNLTPSCIELDRDRSSVSTWDLQYQATKLLVDAGESDLLAEMARKDASDISSCFNSIVSNSSIGTSLHQQIADMAEKDFVEKYGTKAYPINGGWGRGKQLHYTRLAIENDLTPVVLENKQYLMLSVKFRESVIKQSDTTFETVYERLDSILANNKKHMRAKPYRELRALLANTMIRGI